VCVWRACELVVT